MYGGLIVLSIAVVYISSLIQKGSKANTVQIPAVSGLYSYNPYIMNLWNNNAGVVSQVEQSVLNPTCINIATSPTITSGVISNIPVGLYNFNITGTVYGNGNNINIYQQVQYSSDGITYTTIAMNYFLVPIGTFLNFTISINATIRISNTTDRVRLYYSQSNAYDPTPSGSNYLSRYMTITFVSL